MAIRKVVKENYSTENMANEVYDLCGKAKRAITELWMDYTEILGYIHGADNYADTFAMAETDEDFDYIKGLFSDTTKGITELRKYLIDKLNK